MTAAVAIALSELQALGLPDLPSTRQGIERRAKVEGWQRRPREGRGGGYVYEVTGPIAEAILDARAGTMPAADNDIRRGRGRPKGSDFFSAHPEVADAIEAILAYQQVSATTVRDLLEQQFRDLPHIRTLRRFIMRLETEKAPLLASFRDPDLYKGRYRLALGRADASLTHAHQRWELDTTPADVLLQDGRFAILGVIDVWSRRIRFLVAPSESAQSVRRLLVDTMTAWGVMPEQVVTDQGSGYINGSIRSALEFLGIDHKPCPPASPEQKPHIERVFGTFQRERAELLDGYAGHNVAEAQRLRARARKETGKPIVLAKLTAAELQVIIDAWVDGVYHQRRHGTLGVSPMQKWQASPVPAAAAPDRDRLLVALSALVGTLVVGKRGLQWKRGRYWSPALVPFIGRPVAVRRDEEDLGALFVFDEDGHFIDTAVDHQRRGLPEREYAMEARRQQDAYMREARADVRAKMRRFDIPAARDALLRRDAEAAGKLVSLPRPTVERSTPQLDSLAPPPAPALPTEAEMARAEAHVAKTAPIAAQSVTDKVREADAIIAAAHRGEAVDAATLRRAKAYAVSTEYRAEKMLTRDFARQGASHPAPKEKSA